MQTPLDIVMLATTPPFPQVVLFSAGTLIATHLLLSLFKVEEPRTRSLFYGLTLLAPLVVYAVYTPSIWIFRPVLQQVFVSPFGMMLTRQEEIVSVNYTGILCIVGLIFGAATLAVSYLFGVRIVARCRGVIEVTEEDEPRLYRLVEKVAERIGVETPRVGLTENLQPNAFMVGHGREAMVVFSSGLINTLSQPELKAVAAHELSHIKNRDFHLMAVISSLKVASFFSPASYLSASMLSREREYLADEVGLKATQEGNLLKKALVKIASATSTPRGAILPDLVSSLFIYSQIGLHRVAFTSHPSLDMRMKRIGEKRTSSWSDGYKVAFIALALICSSVICFNLVEPSHLMRFLFTLDTLAGIPPHGPAPLQIMAQMKPSVATPLPFQFPGPGNLIVIRLT